MSVTCSNGHVNPDGSAFCDECGERLDAASAVATATPAAGAPVVPTPAPAAALAPKLIVQSDNAVFDLSGKTEVLIGREDPVSNIYPDVDLTPHGGEDGGVSRMHAKLHISGSQCMVEDLQSTNSTFINRQKLDPKTPAPIKDGDELRLGKVAMTFKTA